jgi:FKBP-type peptidyl-prolyl cis-trans isomerase SlpA
MTALLIGPAMQVTLHFTLRLEDGSTIDTTVGGKPATFTMGDGKLLPGFEAVLNGLKAGSSGEFVISPAQGFGAANPNNIQEMPRSQFAADLELVEGLVLSFADAQKAELPGVVKNFDDTTVWIDFNHPLAGRDILFSVDIIDVQPGQAQPA